MSVRKVYLDSTAIIDIVKTEVGASVEPGRQSDSWNCQQLMEAHRNNDVKVLTSTLTIAECTHADGDTSDKVQNLLTKLLTSGDYVELVQMTPFIATDARDLRWKHNISLKGADSIHAASAISMGCEEMLTANGRFPRLEKFSSAFSKLGLQILQARNTQILPAKYRQTDLGLETEH